MFEMSPSLAGLRLGFSKTDIRETFKEVGEKGFDSFHNINCDKQKTNICLFSVCWRPITDSSVCQYTSWVHCRNAWKPFSSPTVKQNKKESLCNPVCPESRTYWSQQKRERSSAGWPDLDQHTAWRPQQDYRVPLSAHVNRLITFLLLFGLLRACDPNRTQHVFSRPSHRNADLNISWLQSLIKTLYSVIVGDFIQVFSLLLKSAVWPETEVCSVFHQNTKK